jgi:uncharacterized protein
MRIGLLADTHDRLPAIAEFLKRMSESGIGMVLHAGDYCAPFSLKPFLESSMALAGVFGRNDGDQQGLRAKAQQGFGIELYESPHSFELGGRQILVVHDLSDVSERSIEAHRVVVHGCSHRQEVNHLGDTLLVNPGEACGWLYATPMAAILDLDTLEVEVMRLTEPEWRA